MTTNKQRRPLLYLVGDSLTEEGGQSMLGGWATLLQDAYIRTVDIVNRGFSGYNTDWFIKYVLPVTREELGGFAPAIITLWLGANDASLPNGRAQTQHVPLDQYRMNLIAILQEFQRLAPHAKILLIAPPVVDNAKRREEQVAMGLPSNPLDRSNEHVAQYAEMCREVVSEVEAVDLLNMHDFFMKTYPDEKQRGSLFSDGLHFTKEGNQVVFDQVMTAIEKLMPTGFFEAKQLPDWKDLA